MPSFWDNTINYQYSKPAYDTVEDQIRQQRIREAEYILEPAIPEEPDRQTELEYMKWLQDDLKDDRWILMRPRKLTAGPRRHIFKNMQQLKQEYRLEYLQWFAVGAVLGWPLAVLVGKKAQTTMGGVPVYSNNKYLEAVNDYDATKAVRRNFRRYAFLTCLLTGTFLARHMTDSSRLQNKFYNRPDFKPKAAMVNQPDFDEVAYQQLLDSNYKNHNKGEELNKSAIYRFFRPLNADFKVRSSLFAERNPSNNYRLEDGRFPSVHNDYADHEN